MSLLDALRDTAVRAFDAVNRDIPNRPGVPVEDVILEGIDRVDPEVETDLSKKYENRLTSRQYAALREWLLSGFQRYRLTDSLAAMFRLTTAPDFNTEAMPHRAFCVEVPQKYLRLGSGGWVYVLFARLDSQSVIAVFPEGTEQYRINEYRGDVIQEELVPGIDACLAERFVGNLVAFLGQHAECARTERTSRGGSATVTTVRHPVDVVVTREIREAAAACAASGDVTGIRRAMAHFVRGHWRNQPVGEGRKDVRRTWVKPHKRGDEAFGRVVERITKVTGGEN